jgi:hypothetical protein
MDDDYHRYPVGSPEHYAAYERHFTATGGIHAVVPGDPQASYEVEHAYELAAARYDECEYLYQRHVEEGARWWRARGVQLAEGLLDDPRAGWARTGGKPVSRASRTSTSKPSMASRQTASRG